MLSSAAVLVGESPVSVERRFTGEPSHETLELQRSPEEERAWSHSTHVASDDERACRVAANIRLDVPLHYHTGRKPTICLDEHTSGRQLQDTHLVTGPDASR
jgi:hypothetical protein